MDTQEQEELRELYYTFCNDLQARGEAGAIVKFLRARGISVPEEAAAGIEATTDRALLARWLDRAATVSSVEELFES